MGSLDELKELWQEGVLLVVAATMALMLAIIIPVWIVSSHFEAQAWNRLTGGDATTWEAMWVELRVDEQRR